MAALRGRMPEATPERRAGRGAGLPLRLHLLAALLLLGGVLTLALSTLAARFSQDLVDRTISAAFLGGADLALQDLHRLEETARAAAEALAADPLAATRERAERRERLGALAGILRAVPGISAAYLGWPDGEFLLLRRLGAPGARLEPPAGAEWLAQWSGAGGSRYDFLDSALGLVERRERPDLRFDPRERPWFVDAQAAPGTIMTAPYLFFTTLEPGVSAARRAASGAVAGVDVSLWDLSHRLPRGHPTASTEAAILDARGGVLAYTDRERLQAILQARGGQPGAPGAESLPEAEELGSLVAAALAARWRAEPAAYFDRLTAGGRDWIATLIPLDEGGSAFAMATPADEIGRDPGAVRSELLKLFGLAMVLIVPFAWLAARLLAQPAEALVRDLERMAALDFTASPRRPSRVRELAELDAALGRMRESIGRFAAICRALVEGQDLRAVLAAILEELIGTGTADRGAAWLTVGEEGRLRCLVDRGLAPASGSLGPEALARRLAAPGQEGLVQLAAGDGAGAAGAWAIPLRAPSGALLGAIVFEGPTTPARAVPLPLNALAEFIAQALVLAIERGRLLTERATARQETGLILASVADGICVLDANGRIRRQNPAVEAILGRSEAEAVGQPLHELVAARGPAPGDGESAEAELFAATLQDGRTRRREGAIFLRKDGARLAVDYECSALRDEAGHVVGAVVSFRDVSARREADARAGELQRRLERLIDQAKVGVLVHRNFAPILANRELARMLGYGSPAEILLLRDCRVLFAEGDRARAESYNRNRLQGLEGEEAPPLHRIGGRRRDGSAIVMDNRAFTIEWGGEMAVCAMLTDITGQLELEEQLRQAQKIEAMGQLTGGVAHDFNNLLTVILGNAELLAESLSGDEDLRRLAEATVEAAGRGAELTDRLLAFARRQPLDPKADDVNRRLAGMEPLLRRTLGEHIEIELLAAPDLWRAMIDPGQLENAVLNLCLNARDAMPEGGRLTIETANVELDQDYATRQGDLEPGPYVLLAVSDSGTGMAKAVMERAFEPFFTTKGVGKGSGLGLSMVYGFVKQSRGHVRLYSEPGAGTTVKLYLPRAGADTAAAASSAPSAAPGPQGGRERILMVEDDALVRAHVRDQLLGLGYSVVTASDGPEALALLEREGPFDLLFTDVVMPGGMSGPRLAEEAGRRWPAMPVLFTSGYTENAVVHHGRLDPGVQLLAKPYRRQDLAAKIRAALEGPADREAGSPPAPTAR